jgi:hypothetical protein
MLRDYYWVLLGWGKWSSSNDSHCRRKTIPMLCTTYILELLRQLPESAKVRLHLLSTCYLYTNGSGIVDLFLPDVCLRWFQGASTIRPLTIAHMLQILGENLFGNWQTVGTCDLTRLPGFKFGMPSWRLCCRITIMRPKTTESSNLSYLKCVHEVGLFISEFQYYTVWTG